jgi:adenylate cyclase
MITNHKKNPKKYTLIFTLTSAFCGLTLLSTLLLTLVTTIEIDGFIREELRFRLRDIVSVMSGQIDGNLHSQIRTVADEKSTAFTTLLAKLQEMRHEAKIANVYTMRKNENGDFIIVVDGSVNPVPIGTIDGYPTDTLKNALNATIETKTTYIEENLSTDAWGEWLSAYVPIFTSSGKNDGIIGIAVSAKNIRKHQLKYFITAFIVLSSTVIVMLPFGFFMARRIRQPLAQLTEEMEKIGNFDLNSEIKIVSRIVEINSMGHQLDSMKYGLRSFKKYVPADLVRELIEMGKDANLEGKKKNLTIFFSDIANFTAISERLEPEKLVSFLGEYLTVMNASLLNNQATVDKYIGDSVMAFWGAPQHIENPAVKSCRAALECQRQIRLLSQKWKSENLNFDFYTRIGIHTGDVIVGNIGSETRMNYTVIGDNVNIASRIESINKFYGTTILISEVTQQEVKNDFITRLIDYVVLVGKATPIQLYELVGNNGSVGEKKIRQIQLYEKAFNFYRHRQFSEAIVLLEKLSKQVPSDCPTIILLERCKNYQINSPTHDWQGEFVLGSK